MYFPPSKPGWSSELSSMKRYCVQVSPHTSQPFSRASWMGSTAGWQETWTTYSGQPATRDSWTARFVASASVSIGRVRACQIGSVLPSATAFLTMRSMASPFSACTMTSAPGVGRIQHRPEERVVVDHDGALVGHEQLVGGHALVRQLGEVLERAARVQVGDADVEADVDHRLAAVDLLVVVLERLGERRARAPACRSRSRVVVPPNAADDGAGGEVVARRRAAEEHLDVRVRVDRARDHVLPGRRRSPCRRRRRATRRSASPTRCRRRCPRRSRRPP